MNPQNTILRVAISRPLVPTTVTRDRARRVCHFAIAPQSRPGTRPERFVERNEELVLVVGPSDVNHPDPVWLRSQRFYHVSTTFLEPLVSSSLHVSPPVSIGFVLCVVSMPRTVVKFICQRRTDAPPTVNGCASLLDLVGLRNERKRSKTRCPRRGRRQATEKTSEARRSGTRPHDHVS